MAPAGSTEDNIQITNVIFQASVQLWDWAEAFPEAGQVSEAPLL